MLPFQVAVALLAFIASAILFTVGGSAAIVGYHLAFAAGILPLILAAMAHFVPVLARSSPAPLSVRLLPLLALLGACSVLLYFTHPELAPFGHLDGAVLTGSAVVGLGAWAWRLRSKAIGTPHPGLDWYLVALACLLLGLTAILLGHWLPEQRNALRIFHLHMNTLGFIGITALGTLQVLLPTVAQKPDPDIAVRMRLHMKWVIAATLVTACTVAWHPAFAWIGLLLFAVPLAGIGRAWLRLYAAHIFALHGAIPSLAAALAGFIFTLVLAAINGYLQLDYQPLQLFIIGFLMPLVIGAASYLLPLWLKPGRLTEWHHSARRCMGFGSGIRSVILLLGGIMAGLGIQAGWWLALLAVVSFVISLLLAMTRTAAAS